MCGDKSWIHSQPTNLVSSWNLPNIWPRRPEHLSTGKSRSLKESNIWRKRKYCWTFPWQWAQFYHSLLLFCKQCAAEAFSCLADIYNELHFLILYLEKCCILSLAIAWNSSFLFVIVFRIFNRNYVLKISPLMIMTSKYVSKYSVYYVHEI